MRNPAVLALEDGTILHGESFGACKDAVFELVFNTSMTGYQEIITDPSYRGQGILFTASHIGNTGVNLEDIESQIPQASAVLVREVSQFVSSWRATQSLQEWLSINGIPGISGIDTRFLTRKLRESGTMKAAISTCGTPGTELVVRAREWHGLDGRDMVREVSGTEINDFSGDPGCRWLEPNAQDHNRPLNVVVLDYGAKRNILRYLLSYGMNIVVAPAYTTCEEVISHRPDGILLSNGPGDPAGLPGIVLEVRKMIETRIPIFGICLGHQLIGRAIGGNTVKLKFGHHSGNHPVLEMETSRVQVTSQNHNYAVAIESLNSEFVEITHLSLNDHTLEGMRLKKYPVFSVQFHPEASPGPHDASDLFTRFYHLMQKNSNLL